MFNGEKYYITTPKSDKQLNFYKANSKEYYDTFIVQTIERPEHVYKLLKIYYNTERK